MADHEDVSRCPLTDLLCSYHDCSSTVQVASELVWTVGVVCIVVVKALLLMCTYVYVFVGQWRSLFSCMCKMCECVCVCTCKMCKCVCVCTCKMCKCVCVSVFVCSHARCVFVCAHVCIQYFIPLF